MGASSYARVGGLAYLVIIASGIYAEFFVRAQIIVPADPDTTAINLLRSEPLFRTALISEVIMLTADIVVAACLYRLFEHVSTVLSLLAAFLRVVHAAVVAGNLLNTYAPLLLLGDVGGSLTGFSSEQRNQLSLLFLTMHAYGYVIGLMFFGGQCLVMGYLIRMASGIPRILAMLLWVAGAGYLLDGFARTMLVDYKAYETIFAIVVFVPAFVGELSFALWLTVRGDRWHNSRRHEPARL